MSSEADFIHQAAQVTTSKAQLAHHPLLCTQTQQVLLGI
jgi:hypothetical protein